MALYQVDAPPTIEPVPYNTPRALVSSSARVRLSNKSEVEAIRQRSSTSIAWQTAAWQCYNLVGEVNYAFNYAASVLSRVRYHAAVVLALDNAPVDVSDAVQVTTDDNGSTRGMPGGIDPRLAKRAAYFMQKFGGRSGMVPIAKAFALNYQVAGECYLICLDDQWSCRSTSEVKINAANQATLQPSQSVGTMTPKRLKKGTPIGRVWNQHPQYSADPDSSLRAVLSDCEELILLARLIRVTARARLNAGILFVPDTMSAAGRTIADEDDLTQGEGTGDGGDGELEGVEIVDDDDEFEKELFTTLTAPVSAEDNAAAIVPMLVRGPADEGEKIKHILLNREVTTELANRSKDVLNRVLQGINAPKELATGISSSRYNNAQLIDEQSYKALVEPLALVLADAITDIYLRPMLRADAEVQEWAKDNETIKEQIEQIVCWYDPSEVVTPVDQSASSNDGWDRNVLSDSAWRKAHGFSDSDKPSEKELAMRLALKQVAVPPDVQQALLRVVLPTIYGKGQEASGQANGVGIPPDLQSLLEGRGDQSQVAPSPPVPATSVPTGVGAPA